MNNHIISCTDLYKNYHNNNEDISILKNINFTINQGDSVAIVGPSGSGKSTLLHLLGGLDKPTNGQILLNNIDLWSISENKRCKLRNINLGFIYQFHHLLPEFTAVENVAIPLLLTKISPQEAYKQAIDLLEKVQLSHRIKHKPAQLSGGERQRVAVARALICRPQCILADEPTGNLDQNTASTIFNLLLTLNQEFKTALIIVTHDQKLANHMNKSFILNNCTLTDIF